MSGKAFGDVGDIWTGANQGLQRFGGYYQTDRKMGGGRHATSINTGYSSVGNGSVSIDPSIRAIQEKYLAQNNNLYNELGESARNLFGNLSGLRERYLGNMAAYTQARVNPLEQQLTEREGSLQRTLGMRGLTGSSFGDQAITNFNIDKNRALGDARAQAESENLQALTGIDGQMAQNIFTSVALRNQINGGNLETAKARLTEEMQALNIGREQQQMMINAFEAWQSRAMQNRDFIAKDIIGGTTGGMNASANMMNAQSKAPSGGSAY